MHVQNKEIPTSNSTQNFGAALPTPYQHFSRRSSAARSYWFLISHIKLKWARFNITDSTKLIRRDYTYMPKTQKSCVNSFDRDENTSWKGVFFPRSGNILWDLPYNFLNWRCAQNRNGFQKLPFLPSDALAVHFLCCWSPNFTELHGKLRKQWCAGAAYFTSGLTSGQFEQS